MGLGEWWARKTAQRKQRRYQAAQAAKAKAKARKPSKLTAQVVELQRTDVTSYATVAGITPDTVVAALNQANVGDIRRLVELLEQVEEKDGHCSGILQTRKLAVVGAGWELIEPPGRSGRRVTAACQEMLDGIPALADRWLDLLDAISKPLSVQEIGWTIDGGSVGVKDLYWVHPKRFRWNTTYTNTQAAGELGELRLLTEANSVYGDPLPTDKFIIHQSRDRSGWPWRAGVGRLLLILYLYKAYGFKDWATFAEIFGQPLKIAYLERGAKEDDWAQAEAALASLGSQAAAVFSRDVELEFEERGANSGESTYKPLIDAINAEMSKAVSGHSAGADSTSGKLGNEDQAGQTKQDRVESDARALEGAIKRYLLEPFVRFNFGADAPVPEIHFQVEPPADVQAGAERIKTLIDAHLPIPVEWAYESQGIPQPQPGEAVIVAPLPMGSDGGYLPEGLPETNPDPPPIPEHPEIPDEENEGDQEGEDEPEEPERDDDDQEATAAAAAPFPGVFRAADRDWRRATEDRIRQAVQRAESLDASSTRLAGPAWDSYMRPLEQAMGEATTYSELRRVLGAVPLDPDELTTILSEAQNAGYVLGRGEVASEYGGLSRPIQAAWEPLPPEEALTWLRSRIPVDIDTFNADIANIKARSFSLAKHEGTELIGKVQEKIAKAIEDGTPYRQFAADYNQMMADLGRTPTNPWHLETVFRTNDSNAIAVGRYGQMKAVADQRPYWQYRTAGDGSVRDEHAALDGLTYRHDHPFWDTYYPPSGYNCRCTCITLDDEDLKDADVTVLDEIPEGLPRPDKGFDSNPAADPSAI